MFKTLKISLTIVMVLGLIVNISSVTVNAARDVKLDISQGSIEISETGYKQSSGDNSTVNEILYTGDYEITGEALNEEHITVLSGSHNITIDKLTIEDKTEDLNVFSPFCIENGSNVNLTIKNFNKLKAGPFDGKVGRGRAGIEVSEGNSITIAGDGELIVHGGSASSGIGGGPLQNSGNITILEGTISSYGGSSTAGNGAAGAALYGGAGIGGGGNAVGGNIVISGSAKVTTEGYRGGAGIGSSGILIAPAYSQQKITISGNAVVSASAALLQDGDSSPGAAIGGGYKCKGGSIEISGNAQVEAIATESGTSIGGGSNATFLEETDIVVKDNANIKALGAGAVPCFGNGQFSTTQGTMQISGEPIIFGYTYGKAATNVNVENKTIAATLTNLSSSVVLKGYFNMVDCLTDSGKDTYLKIKTGDNKSYVVEYSGVNSNYFSDYVLITPSNSFEFIDYKNDLFQQNEFGSKDTVKINFKNGNTLMKEIHSIKNNPIIEPEIQLDTGKGIEGYYEESALTNKWNFNNSVTTDMDLYMKQQDIYTVNFVPNNGDTIHSQDIMNGNKVTQPSGLSKTGYQLVGWYTESGFTNKWNFSTSTVIANMTLYAKWEAIPYTVSIQETQEKILRVQKDGINEVDSTNSFLPTITMQNNGVATTTDYSLLEWEVENIAGFESYAPVCKVDKTTGKITGLKSGVAKVTVKLNVGYDPNDPSTYDTMIIIVPGDVNKTGNVTMYDATIIMRSITQYKAIEDLITHPNKEYLDELADMNGDGNITAYDATIIAKMASQNVRPSN